MLDLAYPVISKTTVILMSIVVLLCLFYKLGEYLFFKLKVRRENYFFIIAILLTIVTAFFPLN